MAPYDQGFQHGEQDRSPVAGHCDQYAAGWAAGQDSRPIEYYKVMELDRLNKFVRYVYVATKTRRYPACYADVSKLVPTNSLKMRGEPITREQYEAGIAQMQGEK